MDTLHTFHVWQNSQSQGPFTVRVMQEKLRQGTLSRETLVAYRGSDEWVPLSTYADLIDPPKMEVVKPPAASMNKPVAADAPLTVNVVVQWLQHAAVILICIGVGLGMLGALLIGPPGLWFCAGPLGLALTAAIFAWSRP